MSKSWRDRNPEKRKEQKKRERARKKLRDLGILPPVNMEMNEEQKKINDQISNNDFSYLDTLKVKKPRKTSTNSVKTKKTETTKKDKVQRKVEQPKILTSDKQILWYQAKEMAEKSNKIFNIDPIDIDIPENCPYLDIKLSSNLSDFGEKNYYTISLKDNDENFTKNNIQVISKLANDIKSIIPKEYLKIFAKNIIKIHK